MREKMCKIAKNRGKNFLFKTRQVFGGHVNRERDARANLDFFETTLSAARKIYGGEQDSLDEEETECSICPTFSASQARKYAS